MSKEKEEYLERKKCKSRGDRPVAPSGIRKKPARDVTHFTSKTRVKSIANPKLVSHNPHLFFSICCLVLIPLLFSCFGCGGGGGGGESKESATISGFIDGDVREGVTVTVSGDKDLQTTTGADGFYLFTLPDGNYTLTASAENYLPVPRSRDIVVRGRNSSNNNFLLARDLGASGHWAKPLEGEISSSPAVAPDGTIYVGSDDSFLYAFQATGDLKWKYHTGGSIQSSPAIDQRGSIRVGSNNHRLYAFDPDGKLQWAYETGGAIQSSPAIDDLGRIYVGSDDNSLYALSSEGDLRWSYKTGAEIQSSPAIDANGIIYFGSNDKNLYALSPDGNLMWKFPTRGAIKASAVIGADNTIYIGSCDHTFYAITPQGNEKWSLVTGGKIRSSCALGSDGTLYFGCDDHCLYALAADGTRKWTYQASSAIGSSPAIDQGNIIYFGCDDGALYALTAQGTVYGAFQAQGGIYSSPCLTGFMTENGEPEGRIYIGSNDRKLYGLTTQAKGAMNSLWPMFRKEGNHQGALPLNLMCSISGRVSGAVARNVVVSLINRETGLTITTTETSGDGTFAFNDIHPGIYVISPQKTGYCFSPSTLEVITSSIRNEGNNFTLSSALILAGKISGAIQKGITVEAEALTGSQLQIVATAVSDNNGQFSFSLPTGIYNLAPSPASTTGYAFSPSTVTVTLTQNTAVTFLSVLRICSISGSIGGDVREGVVLYLDGNNIEGSTIKGMTNTKANGSFEFTVHKGTYTITPESDGYTFIPASRQVMVQNSSSYGGNDFTAYAQSDSHILSGTVSGDIRENVTLTLSGDFSATTSSDSQGNFSFQLSSGHYFLKASKADYTFSPEQREITIQGSDCPYNDFSSARLPYSISGRVFGDVQKGITITLSGQGTTEIKVLTDDQGNFSFTASNGSYILTPAKTGCRFEPESLEVTVQGANRSGLQFTSMSLTGVQQWATMTGGSIYGSPALGPDGTIYVGSYDDGQVYAIGPDGSIMWKFATQKHVFASPVVDPENGTIFVCCTDSYLYAITPKGGEKWKKSLSDTIIATPAVGTDGTLYVGCNDGYLYALNPDNGQQKWSKQLEGPVSSPAVGTDGMIYLGSGQIDWLNLDQSKGSFYALSTTNGQIKWKKEICVFSRPAIGTNGIIYVVASNVGSIYALDTKAAGEATVKWVYHTGGTSLSSPVIGPNGTVYVGCDDTRLYALNPNGSLRWSAATGGKIRSSAAIGSDGTVYIGSNDYYLYAFNSTGGELKWRFLATGGSITSMPLIGKDGTIYVGSQNGLLYAIRSE